jgi:hypothetical protein
MATHTFNLTYYFLGSSDTIDLSSFYIVDTSAYSFSDSAISTKQFSIVYNVDKAKKETYQFYSRFNIKNDLSQKTFSLGYIMNREERLLTNNFQFRYQLSNVNSRIYNFSLKSVIQAQSNWQLYSFNVKYLNYTTIESFRVFNSKFKIEKKIQEIRTLNFPYILSTGNNIQPEISEVDYSNGISQIYYKIDGVSSGVGGVSSLLTNEILVPIIIYVVLNNGAFSALRTARFEIRESNKNTVQTDNGISMMLDVDAIKLELFIDKTVPVSIKIYRSRQ